MNNDDRVSYNPAVPMHLRGEDVLTFERCAWEHARVQFVIKSFKLQRFRKDLLSQAETLHGARHLTFRGFAEQFPSFPLRVVAENLGGQVPLHKNSKAVLPYWFKSFTGLPFMDAYREALRENTRFGWPVGMVFPRRGFQQGLIVANIDANLIPIKVSCFMHRCKLHKEIQTFYVLPFHVLLKQVVWEP